LQLSDKIADGQDGYAIDDEAYRMSLTTAWISDESFALRHGQKPFLEGGFLNCNSGFFVYKRLFFALKCTWISENCR